MTYQEEIDKVLLNHLITKHRTKDSVEFFVTPSCNQKCEYCYLMKHGKELYPPECNKPKKIVKNFRLLLEWLDENKFEYTVYDMFSGEFFALPYYPDLLQVIYDHEKKALEKNPKKPEKLISCPTNGSFLWKEKTYQEFQKWVDKLEEVKTQLVISLSVDGPPQLENIERPLYTSAQKDEENYYRRFIECRKKYHLSCHPMITKNFVKNYKENYDWWIDSTINNDIKFYKNSDKYPDQWEVYAIPMMLEVRDANQWDSESLKNYEAFLNYVADKDFSTIHQNNLDDFGYHFFDDFTDGATDWGPYTKIQPYIIQFPTLVSKMTCSIQGGAVFRLGDLAYIPCHRTCYPQNIYGHLILNEDQTKIDYLKAKNVALPIKIDSLNPNRSMLKCSSCMLKGFCQKGCLGSQFEHTNELFCAIDDVCEMYYVKYRTIHQIAERYDLYNWIEKDQVIPQQRKDFVKYARQILSKL